MESGTETGGSGRLAGGEIGFEEVRLRFAIVAGGVVEGGAEGPILGLGTDNDLLRTLECSRLRSLGGAKNG